MAEYTPTDEEMRTRATEGAARWGFLQQLSFEEQWDQWTAAHDAEVARKTLEAVANWIVDTPQVVGGMSTYTNTHKPETVLEWLQDEIRDYAASISTDKAGTGA